MRKSLIAVVLFGMTCNFRQPTTGLLIGAATPSCPSPTARPSTCTTWPTENILKVEASFEDLGHATWVDFTLIHSGRSFDYNAPTRTMKTDGGRFAPTGATRCGGSGSVMLKAKVWWGDDHPTPRRQASLGRTLLLSESRTASRRFAPRRPAAPGSPPATAIPMCAKRLWALHCGRHLSSLCSSRPGADISLGNGAYNALPV